MTISKADAIAYAAQAGRGHLSSLDLLLRGMVNGRVQAGDALAAGAGITSGVGAVYRSGVQRFGDLIRTSILIDLTGLSSATSDLDVIGVGTSPAHIGRVTKAVNGTIYAGSMTCLEVPASLTDIDLYAATEGTGVFETTGIASLTETALITSGAAWTAALKRIFTGLPTDGQYLYLTNGAADTADPFTAGKFLIELEGYA